MMATRAKTRFIRTGEKRYGTAALIGFFGLIVTIGTSLSPRVAGQVFTETVRRVSLSSSDSEALQDSGAPVVSADGRFVAFDSAAPNLVPGDTNARRDVFVRDRQLGTTVCASVSSGGALGNGDSVRPALSSDGRYVIFESRASNLVTGDTNSRTDVFRHDLQTGATIRVSVSSAGVAADGHCLEASVDASGDLIVFHSDASTLVTADGNGVDDVFLHDVAAGTTMRLSVDAAGLEVSGPSSGAVISADGTTVAFSSSDATLVAGDTNGIRDLFARDLLLGQTFLVSIDSSGVQGNAISGLPGINEDGSVIAFWSNASNLVANDSNIVGDVFVRDRSLGQTTRVSVGPQGAQGNGQSGSAFGGRISLSSDGRYVCFSSLANNFDGLDTNMALDVFVRDRVESITRRVSVADGMVEGNFASLGGSVSADGRYVAFSSIATNLVPSDSNGVSDVFTWNRGPWSDLGLPLAGSAGDPTLEGRGSLLPFTAASLDLNAALPGAPAVLSMSFASIPVSYAGGIVQAWPPQALLPLTVDPTGSVIIPFTFPGATSPMMDFYFQYAIIDAGAAQGLAFSNAIRGVTP